MLYMPQHLPQKLHQIWFKKWLQNVDMSPVLWCYISFLRDWQQNSLWAKFLIFRQQIFSEKFNDITFTDELQTRHNDYNFVNKPACKSYLEKFPYKQVLSNWNSLDIDLKSTADGDTFKEMLKEMYLSKYSCESQCLGPCYSCSPK